MRPCREMVCISHVGLSALRASATTPVDQGTFLDSVCSILSTQVANI